VSSDALGTGHNFEREMNMKSAIQLFQIAVLIILSVDAIVSSDRINDLERKLDRQGVVVSANGVKDKRVQKLVLDQVEVMKIYDKIHLKQTETIRNSVKVIDVQTATIEMLTGIHEIQGHISKSE